MCSVASQMRLSHWSHGNGCKRIRRIALCGYGGVGSSAKALGSATIQHGAGRAAPDARCTRIEQSATGVNFPFFIGAALPLAEDLSFSELPACREVTCDASCTTPCWGRQELRRRIACMATRPAGCETGKAIRRPASFRNSWKTPLRCIPRVHPPHRAAFSRLRG